MFKTAKTAIWLIAIVAVVSCAHAEENDSTLLDSTWGVHQRLTGNSVTQDDLLGALGSTSDAGGLASDLSEYNIQYQLSDGLNLGRAFRRQQVEASTETIKLAIQEVTSSSMKWAPSDKTSMFWQTTTTGTKSIQDISLKSTEVSQMGFSQILGGGGSATTLGFSKTTTTNTTGVGAAPSIKEVQEYLIQAGQLDSGLGMKLNVTDTETNATGGYSSRAFVSAITLPLTGSLTKFNMTGTTTTKNGVEYEAEQIDIIAPLRLMGSDIAAEHHIGYDEAKKTSNKATKIAMPLFGTPMSYAYQVDVNDAAKTRAQQTAIALSLFGTPMSYAYKEDINNAKQTSAEQTDVALTLFGSAMSYGHQLNVNNAKSTSVETTKIAMPLFGKAVDYSYSINTNDAAQTRDRLTEVAAPLLGNPVKVSHKLSEYNASDTTVDTVAVSMPLTLIGPKGSIEHTVVTKLTDSSETQTQTTSWVAPFRIDGKVIGHKQIYVTEDSDGTQLDMLRTELTLPVEGGSAVLQRMVKTRSTVGEEDWNQSQWVVKSPKLKLGEHAQFTVSRTSTQTTDTDDVNISDINLTAQPLSPMSIDAKWHLADNGPDQRLQTHNLSTAFALSKDVALKYVFTEQEIKASSPTTMRHLEFARKPKKDSDVDLSFGYVAYGQSGTETPPGALMNMKFGTPKGIEVTAGYKEFDESKLKIYDDDASVSLVMLHSPSDSKTFRLHYTDTPGRVDAERGIDYILPALGGTLNLGYSQNAVGLNQKTIREADVYQGELKRKVFGDLNVKIGLMLCDYYNENREEKHYDLSLDGGKAERGGNVKLSYATGEKVPKPGTTTSPGSVLSVDYLRKWSDAAALKLGYVRETAPQGKPWSPTSTLSVDYSHKWTDRGTLSLTLSRDEAAWGRPSSEDKTEGVLQYQMSF